MAVFEYEGNKYEYDRDYIKSYEGLKCLATFQSDPPRFFQALEKLFMGHDEEYAAQLGGGLDSMYQLYAAAMEDAGDEAKN